MVEDSGSEVVNAVQADLTYDTAKLQYVSASTASGAFSSGPAPTGGGGSVSISGGSISALTGSQTVGTVTFKMLSTSSVALVSFASSSAIVRVSDTVDVWDGVIHSGAYSPAVAPVFAATAISQSAAPTIFSGNSAGIFIQYRNIGNTRWYDSTNAPVGVPPVSLAASAPINRTSIFSYGWPSGGRPNTTFTHVYEADGTTLAGNQHAVEPGQVARFEFNLNAPWNLGDSSYTEVFQPIREGSSAWSMGGDATLQVTVKNRNAATFYSQSGFPTLKGGSTALLNMQYKNTGADAWKDDASVSGGGFPLHLAATNPINRSSIFGATWTNRSRPVVNFTSVYEADGTTLAGNQHVVQPGQIAKFQFGISVPSEQAAGTYREFFQPILEGAPQWSLGGTGWIDIAVQPAQYLATFKAQSAFPTVARGASSATFLSYTNSGNTPWYDSTSVPAGINRVALAATAPINRSSSFSYGWPSAGRPNVNFSKVYEADNTTLASNQHVVQPGQIARFEFNLTTPWTMPFGKYREVFQPVLEGAGNWNMNSVSWQDVTVQ